MFWFLTVIINQNSIIYINSFLLLIFIQFESTYVGDYFDIRSIALLPEEKSIIIGQVQNENFYHLNIGTFSLNNMCGSKLVAVWLTDINVLSHFILFTFFTILLPEWSNAWKGFALSSYQTVACNVISGKEISNAFDKLKIRSERRSSIKSNTPRNMFNFLFLIQNGSYKYW